MTAEHGNNNPSDTGSSGESTPETALGDREALTDKPAVGDSGVLRDGAALPNKAAEDEPRAWGEREDDDHDAWLKEQRPPHWG